MSRNDDDSIFEQALKGDLPSADDQVRLRKRLLAAGVSVGSGLAATGTASAQVGWGATVAAKVAALSWPMTLVLGAAVATPIVALPVWLSPKHANPAASNPPPARPSPSVVPLPVAALSAAAPEHASSLSPGERVVPAGSPRPTQRAASAGSVVAVRAPEPTASAASASPAVPASASPAMAALGAPSSVEGLDSARPASTLAAETQLLDRAFAELAAGHHASAAALIAEHQRRFPNGLLSQERERARARLEQKSKGE